LCHVGVNKVRKRLRSARARRAFSFAAGSHVLFVVFASSKKDPRGCITLTMTTTIHMTAAATSSLPIVSLAQWNNASTKDERLALANQVREICHSIGFFLLVEHGLERERLDRMFAMARQLFALSPEEKKLIDKRKSRHFRGWEAVGSEYTNNRPDIREQVDLWTEHAALDANVKPKYLRLLGPNQWFPKDVLPGYQELMMEWFEKASEVASQIMEILAVGLGLDAKYFDDAVFGEHRMSLTKLIRYPPTPNGGAGVNAHHDTGFVTLLACETSPGLQVENEAGEWIDVTPPTPDTLVVNLGEMLQGMTGNYYVATPHRVIARDERFSIGYFHGPSLNTRLDLLPLDQSYRDAVVASPRHCKAGFMALKQETEDGVGDMKSTYKPSVYGEQLWNYFGRSYPENLALHYPDDKENNMND
jgi:isopenicillin N synthase-like dioxygenase